MKKLFILPAIALCGLMFNTANAQIRIHIGLDLLPHRVYVQPAAVVDVPPPAPDAYNDDNAPADYDPADDYYYLPDENAYYSVANQCYYYNDGDNWVQTAYLPGDYYNFDWRAARHYEVRTPRPYLHNDMYMNRFHGANFDWARYNGPRGGFDRVNQFDNRSGYDQRMANRDNHQNDNRGFDNRDRGGYDNRGSYGQNVDNGNRVNIQNRDNRPQQFNPAQGNQNRGRGAAQPTEQNAGNRGNNQDRFAQNNRGGYGGHTIANRRMF